MPIHCSYAERRAKITVRNEEIATRWQRVAIVSVPYEIKEILVCVTYY